VFFASRLLDELRVIRDRVEANRCIKCRCPLPSLVRMTCPVCCLKEHPRVPWPIDKSYRWRATCPVCDCRTVVRKTDGKIGGHALAVGIPCRGAGRDPVRK